MTRPQEASGRYLAGLVFAAASIYLGATSAISAMAWRDTYPMWLMTNWFALGLIPSAAAIALSVRAWRENGVALSVLALVIIFLALIVWQLFVVSF